MAVGTPIVAAATSTANGTAFTSLVANVPDPTVGSVNFLFLNAHSTGTNVDPTVATPTGWNLLLSNLDLGTPSVRCVVVWRVFQSGDPTTVTWSWTNTGGANAHGASWPGVDTTTPVAVGESAIALQGTASTSYVTPSITTSVARRIAWFAGHRSGGTWTAPTAPDTQLSVQTITSDASSTWRDSGGDVAAGTLTRTSVSSASTSVAVMGIFALSAAAGSGFTGSAGLSGSGTLSGSGVAVLSNAATLAGSGTLAVTLTGASASGAGALSGSGTLTGTGLAPVDQWLVPPFYAAHRFGSADWTELTMYAAGQAYGWNPNLALEVSCWRTSDGVWVASHDQTTGRVFGTNLDIPTNTWATLSALRTTVGNYPMARLSDVLTAYASTRIIFADNKSGVNNSEFLDILDAAGGAPRTVIKMFYTATSLAVAAHARGYKTWGYYYDADVGKTAPNLASTQANYDIIGMDYLATSGSWTAAKSYGKPVMAHIVDSSSAKTTANGFGADGMMVSKVTTVVPQTGLTGSSTLSGSGTLSAGGVPTVIGSASFSGAGTLSAAGVPKPTGVATLSGSGTLTTAGIPSPVASAGLSGSGTLTAAGIASLPGSGTATLNGVGTLTAVGTPRLTQVGSFSGTGTLVAGGSAGLTRLVGLSGVGVLTAVGVPGGVTPPVTDPPTNRTVRVSPGARVVAVPADSRSVTA